LGLAPINLSKTDSGIWNEWVKLKNVYDYLANGLTDY